MKFQTIKYECESSFLMPDGKRSIYLDHANLLAWHFMIRCEALGTLCRTCMNMSGFEPKSDKCLTGVEMLVTLGEEFGQPPIYLQITTGRVADKFFSFLRDIEKRRTFDGEPDFLINGLSFWAAADSPGEIRFHMERLIDGPGSFTFYPLRYELQPFFEQQRREGRHWVAPGFQTGVVSFGPYI